MDNRLFYMDHLRTFLTILVVFHHAATTYAVPGSWYFFDTLQKPDASFVLMLLLSLSTKRSLWDYSSLSRGTSCLHLLIAKDQSLFSKIG